MENPNFRDQENPGAQNPSHRDDFDPQEISLESLEGVGDEEYDHRNEPKKSRHDSGNIGLINDATTLDGGIAIDGGKLPGNHDDFDGELREGRRSVPGANKKEHPAHAMNKGETKHLGL